MYTLGKKIVVKPLKNDNTTKGGIVIPEHDTSIMYGKVECFGTHYVQMKTGDTVVYEKIDGREVEIDGEMFHVLREEDILVIL